EGTCSLKVAQKLCFIANCCLYKDPKSRPKMSEILSLVDHLIAVPSHATSPAPHFKSLTAVTAIKWKKGVKGKETHDDTKNKAERGSSDMQLTAAAHTPQKRSMKLLRSCF
nr:probable serine/threonine-protein kinase PBL19 [Tanacetum cinerariifolium]